MRLKANRQDLEMALRRSWRRRYLSPVLFGLYAELLPCLRNYATGAVLDAGCGVMPFREEMERLAASYQSLDVQRRAPEVDIIADLQDMPQVASETYDLVVCSEVLEHVPRPDRATAEVARILKPNGIFVISVPHLSRLHEEPHDFYRYTHHGIRYLLENAGFQVIRIVPIGSLFSFLGHQLSTIIVCGTWNIPVVRHVAFWLNAALVTLPCNLLDRLPFMRQKMPVGYVAVGVKRPIA